LGGKELFSDSKNCYIEPMTKAERFQQFIAALREDNRTASFVGPDLAKGILAKFSETETLKHIIVTSLLIRKGERTIAFSKGAVVLTSEAVYFIDAKSFLRRPWTDAKEWFVTGIQSNRRQEVVLEFIEETALHLKCVKRDFYVLEEHLQAIGVPKGETRNVEDLSNLKLKLFQDDLLDHLDATEEQFQSTVPNEVVRKHKKQPELLRDWRWKMWEKRQ